MEASEETMVATALSVTFLGPLVTKTVDLIRGIDSGDTWPKWIWIVASMVLGVGLAFAFNVNVFEELGLTASVTDWVAKALSGVFVAAFGSAWHEVFDAFSSWAKSARATAAKGTELPAAEAVTKVWGGQD